MRTRGATRIGRSAAAALAEHIAGLRGSLDEVQRGARVAAADLVSARPTAVTLRHGVTAVLRAVLEADDADDARRRAGEAATAFAARVDEARRRVAENGAALVEPGSTVLTHCHSSAVVDILARAQVQGRGPRVFATETRPFQQGLITVRALSDHGVAATLIADSAANRVLHEMDVAQVLVGADAVASDGSLFNKIGTSAVALAARDAKVPFRSAAASFKFTRDPPSAVRVEERDAAELVRPGDLPDGVEVLNPVFDRTPPEHVLAYIMEDGVLEPAMAVERALRSLPEVPPW